MKRPGRGLTLAELLVTISLMLLGLSAVFVNIHRRNPVGTSELARVVVNELRQVRAKARATGSPRAFCIPTNNATTPCAQSYYQMGGHGKTAPRVVSDTSGQYPGAYLFVGLWSSAPQSINSLIPPSRTYPQIGPPVPPLVAANWMNPQVRDFVFLFNRDGRLTTNDLPHDSNGNSYIIISDGIEFAAGSAPTGTATTGANAPPYFNLTRVNRPQVIKISPSGGISLSSGLMAGAAPGLTITTEQPGAPSLPPAPPAILPTLTARPIVDRIEAEPKSNPVYSDFDTTIPPDGRVSLTVFAYDPDGEDLNYRFQCTPINTSATGKFTYFDTVRTLKYPDPSVNMGQTRVEWVPPAGVAAGSQFKLDTIISDEGNPPNSQVSTGTVTVDVKVVQDGLITYDRNGGIWLMSGDGTQPKRLSSGSGTDSWPELSPDAQNIVFVSNRKADYKVGSVTFNQTNRRIWTMGLDGSGVRRVSGVDCTSTTTVNDTKNTVDHSPCWSPDGTKIVFARTNTNTGITKLQIIRPNGSWVTRDLTEGTAPHWAQVTPAGNLDIVYEKDSDIRLTDEFGTTKALVSNASDPVWSPDGTRLVYLDGSTKLLTEIKDDATGKQLKYTGSVSRAAFNASGSAFVGISSNQLYRFVDPGLGSPATQSLFSTASMGSFDGHLSWGVVR